MISPAAALTCILLLLAPPTLAAEQLSEISVTHAAFCSLHAREMVFIEALHGSEPLTADTDVILARAKAHYSDCLAVLPALMPLPADTGSLQTWLADIRDVLVLRGAERVASIGTVPASAAPEDPEPNRTIKSYGSPEWREACRAEYRTWDEADGTVIRNGNPERVRCPLVLVDGAWMIP